MIVHGELVAAVGDPMGYVTYVFKILDEEFTKDTKYVMVVKCPNWESPTLTIGDRGYVYFESWEAGKDKWWDGINMNYYKYNFTQFIKFVPEPKEEDKQKYIM